MNNLVREITRRCELSLLMSEKMKNTECGTWCVRLLKGQRRIRLGRQSMFSKFLINFQISSIFVVKRQSKLI